MSIILVNERPNPVVRAGDGPGILYNRDPSTPLYIGSDTSIVNGNLNSASILDPLSSIFVGGDTDIWACAPVGTTPDNAIAVDFIHSGRSQHYTSPSVLTETINGIPETIGSSVGSNLLPVLQEILAAINNLSTGGGNIVTPAPISPVLQMGPELPFSDVIVSMTGTSGTQIYYLLEIPANTTSILFLVYASGPLTTISGVSVSVIYQFPGYSNITVPVQSGYQGGTVTLSGYAGPSIAVPQGMPTVNVYVILTCSAGTWTASGALTPIFQIEAQ